MAIVESSVVVFGGLIWLASIGVPGGKYYLLEVFGWLVFVAAFTYLPHLLVGHEKEALSNGRALDYLHIPILVTGVPSALMYFGTEFLVLPFAMVYLFFTNRSAFLHFRLSLLLVSLVSLVFFVLIPVAPPWAVDHVSSTGGVPWASFPSLHVAAALLIGWYVVRKYWYVWPFVVSVVVIVTGNHYFADVIGGFLLGGLVIWVVGFSVRSGGSTQSVVVSSTDFSSVANS